MTPELEVARQTAEAVAELVAAVKQVAFELQQMNVYLSEIKQAMYDIL